MHGFTLIKAAGRYKLTHTVETQIQHIIDSLETKRQLPEKDYALLLEAYNPHTADYLAERARRSREMYYGHKIFIRALIEFSNHCKSDCYYCGIRRSNTSCDRYRLSSEEIIARAEEAYRLGFRTIVLQSGEDSYFRDDQAKQMCDIVQRLKEKLPDCALTLSLGQCSPKNYKALREAGADRYLLRFETSNAKLYALWHPKSMSWDARVCSLGDLRQLGYVVGTGFIVGAPLQSTDDLASDLKFIERFQPEMCGVGPFVAHHATPFADYPCGSTGLTCYILSIIRLIKPNILLPATTALASLDEEGIEKGLWAGANVVMPNFTPAFARTAYEIYDNKSAIALTSQRDFKDFQKHFKKLSYEIVIDKGNPVVKRGRAS